MKKGAGSDHRRRAPFTEGDKPEESVAEPTAQLAAENRSATAFQSTVFHQEEM